MSELKLKECTEELAALKLDLARQTGGIKAFSWEGEDVLAWKVLHDRFGVRSGFYVDVGAFDPATFSNTYLFYLRGWRGINIDARPGCMDSFRRIRPRDINLEMGIAGAIGSNTYVQFEETILNGFLDDSEISHRESRGAKVVGRCPVHCSPLESILDQYHVPGDFDLLSVDVEGLDLEVLVSINFNRYRPKVVIAEILGCDDVASVMESPTARAMKQHGYKLFSKLDFSVLFVQEAHG